MHITTIQGSPRTNGCTATLLAEFEAELTEHGHTVERVDARTLALNDCIGCGACQRRPDEPGCVQTDLGNSFFSRLAGSDIVVFASPLYFWEFPGAMKRIIDRSLCVATGYMSGSHRSLLEGSAVALLLTCGGPERANTDEIQMVFRRYSVFLKAGHAGQLIVPFCSEAKDLKPSMKEEARKFARVLVGLEPSEEPVEPGTDDEDEGGDEEE